VELAKIHWLRPELVAEITYLSWPDDGLLRHTVFVGLREDKPARGPAGDATDDVIVGPAHGTIATASAKLALTTNARSTVAQPTARAAPPPAHRSASDELKRARVYGLASMSRRSTDIGVISIYP
jgi:hypothetical protein